MKAKLVRNSLLEYNEGDLDLPKIKKGSKFHHMNTDFDVKGVEDGRWIKTEQGKMFDLKALLLKNIEILPPEKKPRKPREKRMTKREYWKELKDMVSGMEEEDHSIFYDLAENLYRMNGQVSDYIERQYKDEYLSRADIIERITWDMETFAK